MYLGAGAEVSPDSPVNFSHVALRIPESDLFAAKPAWGTGHCPVHHRTVLCTQTEQTFGCFEPSFSN
jgi:hypothetical protein